MDEYQKQLKNTLHFLKYRGRSEKEIRDYLKKKNVKPENIGKIIQTLREHRFLNDEQFARDWVHGRTQYRLKSKRVIKIELVKKGIDPKIIETVLQESEENNPTDEEQAKKLIRKRIHRLKGVSREEAYKSLAGFLGRRGFDWDTINACIDEVLDKEYNKAK